MMKRRILMCAAALFAAALLLPGESEAKRPKTASLKMDMLERIPLSERMAPTHLDGNARVNTETGRPITLYNLDHEVTGESPREMARQYLREARETLHISERALDEMVHRMTRAGQAGTVVRFVQHAGGVPVYGADVAITIDHDNSVVFVMNGVESVDAALLPSTHPSLSAAVARTAALEYLEIQGALSYEKTELVVYPNGDAPRLAWKMTLHAVDGPIGEWEILFDAHTGEIFRAEDKAFYATGTGYLWDPDPLSSAQVSYGGNYADNSDSTNAQLDAERFLKNLPDILFSGGQYKLEGPYAEVIDFENPFRGLFAQAGPDFLFNRQDNGFEAVLCYWHIDNIMRYINTTLGLTLSPYQYGGGVQFDPHGLSGSDNSYYLSGSGRISFGEGGVDDSEDADVVIHELGHGIHDWLTGGSLSQVNGLSEGFGDYMAASYSRSLGQWVPGTPEYQWVFSWDGHNPFWGGRKTNYGAIYPGGLINQIHTDGQIWSTGLMRIWNDIGRELTDKACLEGLAMTNSSTNQEDAAQAMLQAAINMNYSGSDITAMIDRFTERGYSVTGPATGITEGTAGRPISTLFGAAPNPFRESTRLAYSVSGVSSASVEVAIYNVAGRRVRNLVNESKSPGAYETTWDGRDDSGAEVRSGVYFWRVAVGNDERKGRVVHFR